MGVDVRVVETYIAIALKVHHALSSHACLRRVRCRHIEDGAVSGRAHDDAVAQVLCVVLLSASGRVSDI
jgi:hypothetical protein